MQEIWIIGLGWNDPLPDKIDPCKNSPAVKKARPRMHKLLILEYDHNQKI